MTNPTWSQVVARRLQRHGLNGTPAAGPASGAADLARALCGVHAQVMPAAELSLGLRMPGTDRMDVRAALWETRSLVKTHGPRGTVHLLPARDLPMWCGALAALPAAGGHAPELRLTPAQTEQAIEAVAAALDEAGAAGRELIAEELDEAVIARTGPWAGERVLPAFQGAWPRWRQVISTAAHRGVLCYGPNRGRRVTYTSPGRALPDFRPTEGAAAIRELTAHYLHSYGPATPQQYARWLSTRPGWAAELFAAMAGEGLIEEITVDGEPGGWVAAGDTEFPDDPPSGLRLLPYFDAYGIGCFPRERVFPGRAFTRALARGQAGNYPLLLDGGTVAGVWHLKRSGKRATVTVEALESSGQPSAADLRELTALADRVGEVVQSRVELSVGEVSAGPHL